MHWLDLYIGFGLAISVAGFASTIMAWRLSAATALEASLARMIAWLLCIVQIANVLLGLDYFGPVQAAFSLACAALLAWGALRLNPAPA